MIPCVEWGVQGLSDLVGGLPLNSSTLVYGPPKTGKSVFCYEFAIGGLKLGEPCLYLSTDYNLKQFLSNLFYFGWNPEDYLNQDNFFLIDADSSSNCEEYANLVNYNPSSVTNPTDIMVKLGIGTSFIQERSPSFRSVLDSITSLIPYNQNMLLVRVIKAYILRTKQAGGTTVIAYTEGTADTQTETFLKSMVDNLVYLDGKNLTVEARLGDGSCSTNYMIGQNGLDVGAYE
jgi:KaiC/GvpD/RAD55 family RecA-like ATPase